MAYKNGHKTPEHAAWASMIQRCENPKNPSYRHYGARGIRVCESWHTYRNFLQDMGRRPADHLSLHRIDNDGDYEPGNCKWATIEEQASNRRPNKQPHSLKARMERRGLPYTTIYARIHKGLSEDEAINQPRNHRAGRVSISVLARRIGMSRQAVWDHLHRNWTLNHALHLAGFKDIEDYRIQLLAEERNR